MCPSTRFLKCRLLLLRRVRAGDSVSCGWCLCGCLAFCCFHATLPRNLRQLQPRMPSDLGRNSHDAETAQIAPRQQKGRTSLEAETALSLFGLKQPRIPSDLGRNSLDADTAPKQLGLASPRSSSCLANPPRTSCLRLHAYLVTCAFAYLLTYSLTYLLT